MSTTTRPGLVARLHELVDGEVIVAGQPGYDRARTPFFANRSGHPNAVVRPRHAGDVAATVRLAAEREVPLAVRGGGHGWNGTGDGLLLDLGSLLDLDVDLPDGSAWVGGGFTGAELSAALGAHDVAVGLGDTGSVGIGGLTLGGGMGFLSRRHGLTIDNLLAAELVTADGRVRTVDATHDPELFWAVRGGGGSVGVATRFRYRLVELPTVYGGLLMLPATPRTLAELIAACAEAEERLTAIVSVMPAPPVPGVPDGLLGTTVLMAAVCFAGPPDDGVAALRPLRTIAPPLVDGLGPMPYPDLLLDSPSRGARLAVRTMFVDEVAERDARVVLDHLDRARSPLRIVQIRVLGGAVGRVPADATAYAHRSSRVLVNAVHGDEPDLAWADSWTRAVAGDLHQGDDGAYVNFLGPDADDRVQAAYPPSTLARLRRIKAEHDPTNLFRGAVRIEPDPTPA